MHQYDLPLADLFERLKDSLTGNRLGDAYRAAAEGNLNPKIAMAFRGLAELVGSKQKQLERAGELNRFYRTCIRRVLEQQPLTSNLHCDFSHISHTCRELLLDLETLFTSTAQQLHTKSEESSEMRERLSELEERIQMLKGELEQARTACSLAEEALKSAGQRIATVSNEAEMAGERAYRRVQQLEKELSGRNTAILDLKERNSVLQKRYREIQQEIAKKEEFSKSISDESEHLSQILREEVAVLRTKKKVLEENLVVSKHFNSAIMAQSSIVLSISNQHELPEALSLALELEVGREVRAVERLYGFRQQRTHNFHESVDKKQNILLICLTATDQVIGAFTTAAFTLASQVQTTTKAFLFGMAGEEISLNLLKYGRESVAYDWDFLIFGNDELCIENGKSLLTSYSPTAMDSQLHFERPLKEDHFLAAVGKKGRVELKNYEIYTVDFQK